MPSSTDANEKVHENRLRRMAERRGWALQKSRARDPRSLTYNRYRLVDARSGAAVAMDDSVGRGFPFAGLDQVEAWLKGGDGRLAVLRDKSANLRRLKKWAHLINIIELNLEGRPNQGTFVNPLLALGHARLGEAILASDADVERYQKIRAIIGHHNVPDALTIDAAYREGHVYLVTEDRDEFIKDGKRERLEMILPGLKIVTPDELEAVLGLAAG